MRILTAATEDYYYPAAHAMMSAHLFTDLPCVLYDLSGHFGWREGVTVVPLADREYAPEPDPHTGKPARSPFKPDVILHALHEFDDDMLWIDADCLITDDVSRDWDGCDIGLTVRSGLDFRPDDPMLGPINAGVMFFSRKATPLVERWVKTNERERHDQRSIAQVLSGIDWEMARREGMSRWHVDGKYVVQVTPTCVHNDYYHDRPHGKILHFKELDTQPSVQQRYGIAIAELRARVEAMR